MTLDDLLADGAPPVCAILRGLKPAKPSKRREPLASVQ